jgi:non-specific serine/threonine protein kinase
VIPPAFESLSDRYRITAEIGIGGMATVYLADDVRHRRQVAIKVLKPEISAVIGRERFLREIEIAARLNHPHIVPLFDSGAAGDLLYYVMPYVRGESLRARLQRQTQLPIADALRLTGEIAAALGHAHQQDLVHRDIKPENILIVDDMALVADFGIARTLSSRSPEEGTQMATMAGAVIGTPQYMSPEQAVGGAVDQRSDLYSLACVLFEMLAGQPPFVAPTADALLRMHVATEARPVTESRPSIPAALARVVARGLAKQPEARFASTAQFVEAIAAAMTEVGTAAAPQPAAAAAHNLPRPRTRFIGREREIAECTRLLDDTRLLTLTGIGGGGKTRLAIRVAEAAMSSYPDGIWFVDLAPVSDGGRVLETIAAVFGVRESPGQDLQTTLGEHLGGRRLLLVLDNCEHLLAAVAGTVDYLLESAPGLRVLATSREGLGIDGERLFAVRSLAAPPPEARDSTAVAASHAVQLFMDRAQRIAPDFALTDDNAETVAEICRRLDGIPLALELAAARVKLLSVRQIRSRLDDRFRLLTGGKTALPRQQTLQAAIQWSYDQLAAEEQRLLRLLSVFVGGWTLEIAARVCTDAADEFGTLDLLSQLVDKSLVLVTRRADGDTRYTLLETVRQYAAERLLESGEATAVRRRHAEAFLAIAERAYAERVTKEAAWAQLLDTEHDNVRAVLALFRDNDPERYLEMAGALAWFWHARSYLLEGREHLTLALAASPATPARKSRARALWGGAYLHALRGDTATSTPMMAEALQMWREVGALAEVAEALEGVGWAQFLAGQDEQACVSFEESLRLQRETGDPHLVNRAQVALAQALVALGRVAEARTLAAGIIAFSHQHGNLRAEHSGWHYTADCALMEHNYRDALGLYRTSLTLARQTGDRLEIGFEVQGVGMSLAGLGQADLALRLGGAVEAEYERIGSTLRVRFWDALLATHFGMAREALGGTEAARAWARGRGMSFDAAIEEALGEPNP